MPHACVVVCGPSGCGKSTVGKQLADILRAPFLDADDFHSDEAKSKMASGEPLTDADRAPWLERISAAVREEVQRGARNVVVACSALRLAYRDKLRREIPARTTCLLLDVVEPSVLRARTEKRTRDGLHFMPSSLLASQLATLERGDDLLCVRVTATEDVASTTAHALAALKWAG